MWTMNISRGIDRGPFESYRRENAIYPSLRLAQNVNPPGEPILVWHGVCKLALRLKDIGRYMPTLKDRVWLILPWNCKSKSAWQNLSERQTENKKPLNRLAPTMRLHAGRMVVQTTHSHHLKSITSWKATVNSCLWPCGPIYLEERDFW